jgi:hypothetical protein
MKRHLFVAGLVVLVLLYLAPAPGRGAEKINFGTAVKMSPEYYLTMPEAIANVRKFALDYKLAKPDNSPAEPPS